MTLVKTEIDNILRDMNTGALLNNDTPGLSAYKKNKQRQNEINSVVDKIKEIDLIKQDINEIKKLLTQIVEKL